MKEQKKKICIVKREEKRDLQNIYIYFFKEWGRKVEMIKRNKKKMKKTRKTTTTRRRRRKKREKKERKRNVTKTN